MLLLCTYCLQGLAANMNKLSSLQGLQGCQQLQQLSAKVSSAAALCVVGVAGSDPLTCVQLGVGLCVT
jgi:hypothetical protein